MRNGGKKGLEPYGPAYCDLIQLRCDHLRRIAADVLQMQGIEDDERDNMERALKLLGSIDALVKIIDGHPRVHVQAHALMHLWKVIGGASFIGSRGENLITEKFLKDKTAQMMAKTRKGKPSTKHHDQIKKIIADRVDAYLNPKREGKLIVRRVRPPSVSAIAEATIEGVNADLVEKKIIKKEKPRSVYWLRTRIVLPSSRSGG